MKWFKEQYKSFNWMDKFIFYSFIFIGVMVLTMPFCHKAEAQPLKVENEFVIEAHHIENCFKGKCNDVRLAVSIFSQSIGNGNLAVVYKMEGEKGHLGSQLSFYLNDYFWLAGETVGNLEFDLQHEVLLGVDFKYGTFTFLPYFGFYPKSHHWGGAGIKSYIKDVFAFGIEYRIHGESYEEYDLFAYISIPVYKKALSQIPKLFGIHLDDKEKEHTKE